MRHHADREALVNGAAGLTELHAAAVRALRAALDHLGAPGYLRLIMYLSMVAYHTLPGAPSSCLLFVQQKLFDATRSASTTVTSASLTGPGWMQHSREGNTKLHVKAAMSPAEHSGSRGGEVYTMLPQLARVQQLAASWVNTPPHEQPSSGVAEGPLAYVELLSFADQVRACCRWLCQPEFASQLRADLACHGRQRLFDDLGSSRCILHVNCPGVSLIVVCPPHTSAPLLITSN